MVSDPIRKRRSVLKVSEQWIQAKEKDAAEMTDEEKETSLEEETCKPLTDEEFKEYLEKDARTTKKVLGFFSAIWEAILLFFS